MMQELLKSVVWRTWTATDGGSNGPVVFTSTGIKAIFTAVSPVRMLKWGFLVNAVAIAQTSSAMAIKLTMYPTVGSSANAVDIDTLTTGAAQGFALGTGGYRDFFTPSTDATTPASQLAAAGPLGSADNNIYSGQQQAQLSVGQGWVFNVTTDSDNTGQGIIWLEYVLLPISKPSGYGYTTDPDFSSQPGSVSLTDNYTRFAS